ncbi:uncharacterized protein JCM6883_005529 [Sporobolomyces salmoneus]|uniref:uncharacterized protein n=1 Tax=Sporobolomyces salmoneus TaxID=183962 RepID=UPI0031704191
MLSPVPLVLSLVASSLFFATVQALPTSEAPTCAIKCFQKKVEEGEYLAPGAEGLHGLCSRPNWVKAYNNCLDDNCKPEYVESAYLFGVNVCTGKITTSAAHGDTSSARKLSKCTEKDCPSSTSSASSTASLTGSDHPATCTCTETSHAPGATQAYVGVAANVTSSMTQSTASASIQSQAAPTATSGASTLSIGFAASAFAVLAASLS